jgi:hypothetical protein
MISTRTWSDMVLPLGRPVAVVRSARRGVDCIKPPEIRHLERCHEPGSPGTARLPRPRAMRVRFDWDYDGIACRGADLEKPIPGSDPAMARYLTEYFDSILPPPRSEVSETVRELMWVLLKSGNCSAERVAKQLGADRRTINRSLATEGRSYSSILDAVRRDIGLTPVKYPS